jgi:hypothetical protein
MPFHLHKDGVEFLKDMGILALILAAVVFRFSGWGSRFIGVVMAKMVDNFPGPSKSPEFTGAPGRHRRSQRQRDKIADRKRILVFDWFLGVLVVWVLLDCFVLPDPYRVGDEHRWPMVLLVFLGGSLIIFFGSQAWDGRMGWRKWTFWISLVAALMLVSVASRWLRPTNPDRAFLLLLVGGLSFIGLFGRLRVVDKNEDELRRVDATAIAANEPKR